MAVAKVSGHAKKIEVKFLVLAHAQALRRWWAIWNQAAIRLISWELVWETVAVLYNLGPVWARGLVREIPMSLEQDPVLARGLVREIQMSLVSDHAGQLTRAFLILLL